MKSTIALFVLCASFCLSATAQVAHRSPMKLDQLQTISAQKQSLDEKTTIKKEKRIVVIPESKNRKVMIRNNYQPLGRSYSIVKSNTTRKKQESSSLNAVKPAKQE